MLLKLAPAVLALTIAMAAPAHADPVRFHYYAHELATPSSVEHLYARLNDRAESACISKGSRGLWRKRAQMECFEFLLSDFVVKIGDSSLVALHTQASDARFAIRD